MKLLKQLGLAVAFIMSLLLAAAVGGHVDINGLAEKARSAAAQTMEQYKASAEQKAQISITQADARAAQALLKQAQAEKAGSEALIKATQQETAATAMTIEANKQTRAAEQAIADTHAQIEKVKADADTMVEQIRANARAEAEAAVAQELKTLRDKVQLNVAVAKAQATNHHWGSLSW